MACYIRKLIVVDEYNEVIYKAEDVPMDKGLNNMLDILKNKHSMSKKSFVSWLDDELKTFLGFDKK